MLGESDGVPKTPEWAEGESGIPAREIRALAREWGAKKTMLAAGGLGGWGGACRSATGNEWARAMIALAAMQGMGKPGSNIWGTTQGAPVDCIFMFPGYAEGGISGDVDNSAAGLPLGLPDVPQQRGAQPGTPHHSTEGQTVPRLRIPEAMMHEQLEWRGKGFCGSSIESQFQKYEYPAPGYPDVEMYYRYGGSFFGTMTETNRYVRAYREGKVPFVVNQSIWFEGEAKFADIILPACTNFERWDISEFANCSGYIPDNYTRRNHRVIVLQKKCIEPLGESKSDYEIFAELSPSAWASATIFTDGRQGRARLGQGLLPRHRPAQADHLGGVREEGLLRGAVPGGPQVDSGHALVRRRAASETPRTGVRAPGTPSAARACRPRPARSSSCHPASSGSRRRTSVDPERPAMGPQYIPSWEGHHTDRALRQVPAADGLPAPALQLPHHGRRQGELDERGQGPPGAQATATTTGSCVSTPRTRRRGASPTAT